ncbi:Cyclic nucleotide-gated potassium channel [Pirellulimonas nuda]|uniref:Cyclic nucleotide-gated potassium channel n=1 Tax=Pirellulimonas nuda TaxID=2528009 RepID=A0A518DGV8_9BACT|nr:ion transporter [Pirellulimonas nuda]QDU90711.1 Cyclic nucleotide-gated potassium channel [Pirellulimonas nuda]
MNRIRARIAAVVDDPTTRIGFAFAITIQLLIIASLVTFAVDTLPDLPPRTRDYLELFEVVTVGVFSLEYLLRIFASPGPIRFICSFFGLMDLLAILPFYLTASLDLRAARSFRLLRLFRIFKLARYSAAVRRFHRAFLIAKEELVLFLMVALILLYLSAVGIYYCENEAQPEKFCSVFHSLWWSVATLTTVGYGDIYPVTVAGKAFTFLVLLVGLGVVSVPAGLVASALAKAREMESVERK